MFHFSRSMAAGFAAVLFLLAAGVLPAHADTSTETAGPDTPTPSVSATAISATAPAVSWSADATPPAGAVEDCLQGGDIWLIVVTDTGGALANGCIGRPVTGTDALIAARLKIDRDASQMICALGGYPNPCPAAFDGKFWQYYQGSATAPWTFAATGPDTSQLQGGTLEGWCYGEQCTPPPIDLLLAGATTTTSAPPVVVSLTPAPSPSPTPAVVPDSSGNVFGGVVAVIALVLVVAVIVWSRVRHSGATGRAEA